MNEHWIIIVITINIIIVVIVVVAAAAAAAFVQFNLTLSPSHLLPNINTNSA